MFLFCPQPNTLARLRAPLSLPPSSRDCFSVHNNRGGLNTGRHLASEPLLMAVCSLVFVTIFACIRSHTGTQMAVTSDIDLDVQSVHTRAFWEKRCRNCPCNISWPLEGGHVTYHQLKSADGSQLHSLTLYLLVPKTGQTLETEKWVECSLCSLAVNFTPKILIIVFITHKTAVLINLM